MSRISYYERKMRVSPPAGAKTIGTPFEIAVNTRPTAILNEKQPPSSGRTKEKRCYPPFTKARRLTTATNILLLE